MPGYDTVARGQQLSVAGKIMIVKRPIGVIIQFFVALVEAVSRREERDRIGNVDSHGKVQLPADIPHGIKSGIIDLDQGPGSDVFA